MMHKNRQWTDCPDRFNGYLKNKIPRT